MFIYFPVIVSSVSYVCSMYTWILISYERCCSVDSWMVFISCEMLLWDVATRDQMPGSFQIFSNGMLPSNTDSCCPKWPGAYMPRSTPSRRTGLFSVCKCTDWRMTGLFLYSHYPSLSNIMSPCNQTWRAGNVTILVRGFPSKRHVAPVTGNSWSQGDCSIQVQSRSSAIIPIGSMVPVYMLT